MRDTVKRFWQVQRSARDRNSDAKCTLVTKCTQDEKHLSLFRYWAQNLPSFFFSVVEHRSAESRGLRFDSTWELRFFSLSYARNKTKNIFLNFFTELKTYYLSYSIYKGFIIPLLFSFFRILILVCELHSTALSVRRIHHIRCTRKKKTRIQPFKCYLCSFLLKNSLL